MYGCVFPLCLQRGTTVTSCVFPCAHRHRKRGGGVRRKRRGWGGGRPTSNLPGGSKIPRKMWVDYGGGGVGRGVICKGCPT